MTGELAALAETTAAQAAGVLRNGRRAVPRALSGRMRGRLRRALAELAVTLERTATIVTQVRTRLAGQMPDGATRLVSLHDPDARPIRKGRIDRPVEFGYKAQVSDNDDGIVLDYAVECGAVPDGPAAGAGDQADRPPGLPRAPRGDRRPRLRPGLGRAGSAGAGRPDGRDSPAGQTLSRPGRPSSTAAASAGWSSGGPGAKAGSATSSAATAGTGPSWTAETAPPSGAGTGYSPTT